MENVKGVVEKVNYWKNGKGYFVKLAGDEREYYRFGSNGIAPGLEVELKAELDSSGMKGKYKIFEIVKAEKKAGPEQKKEFPVDSMDGIDAKAKAGQEKRAAFPPILPPMTKEEEDQYCREWRALATATMSECYNDAKNCLRFGDDRDLERYACAIFDKRMSPLYFYIEKRRLEATASGPSR